MPKLPLYETLSTMLNNVYDLLRRSNPEIVFASTFLIALLVRLALIAVTPSSNDYVDIGIYVDSGQLVAAGINPYDFNDGKELREQLRTDEFAYHSFTCETQERWNYYANSNLPLTLLYLGAIEYLFPFNIWAYRITFAVVDSLLSATICLFVLRYWKTEIGNPSLIAILSLGVFSPWLLFEGTIIPEDKGLQTLFMMLALYFSFAKPNKFNYWLTILFLGASIAFKALGLLLIPICFLALEKIKPVTFSDLFEKQSLIRMIKFTLFVGLSSFIYFVPFIPEVLQMAAGRLATETSVVPRHAAIWTLVAPYLPSAFPVIRVGGLVLFLGLLLYGICRKSFGAVIVCCALMILFINYWLLSGDMTRMIMPITVSLLALGSFYRIKALTYYYAFGSAVAVALIIFLDRFHPDIQWNVCSALFLVFFLILFFVFVLQALRRTRENLLA